MKKYTVKEIDFLKKNYPLYGSKYCANILKRKESAIYAKANKIGLKRTNRPKHDMFKSVSVKQFQNITNFEVAYFLGFFWADGYIKHYISNNINNWKIVLEINKEDAENIEKLMTNIGKWAIFKRKRKRSWKETWSYSTNNEILYKFLENNDFNKKSNCEPTKILNQIPCNLHCYFWRGFFDGDGSCCKNGKRFNLKFSRTYNSNFLELQKKLLELNIKKFYLYKNKCK